VALDVFWRPITALESRQWFTGNNLHSAALNSRGPNSYDDGVHILGQEETIPYMGTEKNSTNPLINRLYNRIGKVDFN